MQRAVRIGYGGCIARDVAQAADEGRVGGVIPLGGTTAVLGVVRLAGASLSTALDSLGHDSPQPPT